MFDQPPPNLPISEPPASSPPPPMGGSSVVSPGPMPAAPISPQSSPPPAASRVIPPVSASPIMPAPVAPPPPINPSPVIPPLTPVRPASGASEPEDIFSGVDGGSKQPAPLKPPPELASVTPPKVPNIPADYLEEKRAFPWKGVVVGVVALAVLGGAGYAAYLYRDQIFGAPAAPAPADTSPPSDNDVLTIPFDDTTPPPTTPLDPANTPPVPVDSDGDRLSDDREQQLGTNPSNPDTDSDGLFDGQEADSFQSDPLRADTDGDGYSDGTEVQNGFNPLGPGRLFAVPESGG